MHFKMKKVGSFAQNPDPASWLTYMLENHLIQKSLFLKLFCYFYSKMVLDDLILAVKTLVNVFFFF